MKTCPVDQFDFVSIYGAGDNYGKSWKKTYPDQKNLVDLKLDSGVGKTKPIIKGFYCSCLIDGTEGDADGTEGKASTSASANSDLQA